MLETKNNKRPLFTELDPRHPQQVIQPASQQVHQQKERQRDQELQDFAYIASYHLQEPLRTIQGFGSQLVDKYDNNLPEPSRDYLSRLIHTAERMQTLIDDLLFFSEVIIEDPVDLSNAVPEIPRDVEVQINKRGSSIDIGTLPPIRPEVCPGPSTVWQLAAKTGEVL